MEIGYIQAPHKTLPVVFDSPRDRGLKDFPVKRVMVGNPLGLANTQAPMSLALRPPPLSVHLSPALSSLVLKAEFLFREPVGPKGWRWLP